MANWWINVIVYDSSIEFCPTEKPIGGTECADDGSIFSTFSEAKRHGIKEIKDTISNQRRILKYLKKIKKSDFTKSIEEYECEHGH